MNVYDFDKTIYNGDSTLDFYFFILKKHPLSIRYIFIQVLAFILYKLKIKEKHYFKEKFYIFLQGIKNIDEEVKLFWKKHEHKIKKWYLEAQEKEDLIISASPEFLLIPISKKLKFNLIASKVDKKTGQLLGENCYGAEKVIRFNIAYKNKSINKFYSDSKSDKYLKKLAKEAFLVNKNNIKEWL
jgi:Phosphoserine phosphatase